ncbi:transcriptional regulator [Sporomusa aerivorans]|uniref:transcriptional regulator n=1 Tax=Sporomusa aerivorans TaxID=204936 RepID=UPI00352A5C35
MLLRIGEKIINRQKIHHTIDRILELRRDGFSQQDVAGQIGVDRTFVSRLETIGEIRKGGRVALIGFPIKNCEEIYAVARQEGIDFCFVLSEQERWDFVQTKSGVELFNTIMQIITDVRKHDIVIIIGSNMRIKLIETLLDKAVIGIQIGESPIEEDKYVSPEDIRALIRQLRF